MNEEKALKDLEKKEVTGFIYEYVRKDNDEVVYRGSSEHKEDQWGSPLEKVDKWHREGHNFKTKYPYSWTVFRTQLRTPFGKKVEIRYVHDPKEMNKKQLLELERNCIQEMQSVGQCYLNHTSDPLKSYLKWNTK